MHARHAVASRPVGHCVASTTQAKQPVRSDGHVPEPLPEPEPEPVQSAGQLAEVSPFVVSQVPLPQTALPLPLLPLPQSAGQLVISYKVYRCWVSEFQALPDLDANANAVAIQTLKLENEGWERDLEVAEPDEPLFTVPAVFRWTDAVRGERVRAVDVVPEVTANLGAHVYLFPDTTAKPVTVWMRNYGATGPVSVRLVTQRGWSADPVSQVVTFKNKGDEARVILAPASGKAQVAIAERAGERDLADRRRRIERRRRRFERGERAVDLALLQVEPFLLVLLGRAPSALVDEKNAGIEDAVAQRLERKRRDARVRVLRNDLAAPGALIEILEDHRRVVQHGAVLDDQRGDFSERILPTKAVARVGRIGLLDRHVVLEPKNAERELHLAAERRRRRGTQDHHVFGIRECGAEAREAV